MILTKRDEAEQDLAQALDRHIGYTTGAFDLERIAGVALLLERRTTLWDVEIVNRLTKTQNIGEDYARGVLDFGVGLGLVRRFESGSAATRIGLTDLGRSYCGAFYCNNAPLQRLVLTYAVLASDCDLYGLLLNSFTCRPGKLSAPQQLARELQALREKRVSWLREYFPDVRLRRRITDRVSWLQKGKGDVGSVDIRVKDDYARHHSFPRKGWAKSLGHVGETGDLTAFGREVGKGIRDVDNGYFWLGPAPATLDRLRLPEEAKRQPLGPVWSLLRPQERAEASIREIRSLANFMEKAYPAIRLTQSNQASIDVILPVLYMHERDVGVKYDEKEVLRLLFSRYGDRFAPMSKRSGLFGHYQLRLK